MKLGPMRKVVDVERLCTIYNRPGEGCHCLKLECGHEIYRKTSIPVPARAHCRNCLVRACVCCGTGKNCCDNAKRRGWAACCSHCEHPDFQEAPAPCRRSRK